MQGGLEKKSVKELLILSKAVGKELERRRHEIVSNLAALRGRHNGSGRLNPMKGRKIAPKYRGPGGETWAGRGARPRWLTALLKKGRKLERFRIKGA